MVYIADPNTAKHPVEPTGPEERFDHTSRIVAHPRPEPSLPNPSRPHSDRRSRRAPEIYVEPKHEPVATLRLMGKQIVLGLPSKLELSASRNILAGEALIVAVTGGFLYGNGVHSLSLRAFNEILNACSSGSGQRALTTAAIIGATTAAVLAASVASLFIKVTDQPETRHLPPS